MIPFFSNMNELSNHINAVFKNFMILLLLCGGYFKKEMIENCLFKHTYKVDLARQHMLPPQI